MLSDTYIYVVIFTVYGVETLSVISDENVATVQYWGQLIKSHPSTD